MVQVKKTLNKALGRLAAEMARPNRTASVLRSKLSKPGGSHRKLELIDAFHGYACSWCGCRFPESALSTHTPKNLTVAQKRRRLAAEREKQFAAHVCSR
jgi:predicted adenine nucleotide alpha hydrolase (AANH) superfamily ATPase